MICVECRDRQLKGTAAALEARKGKHKPRKGTLLYELLGGEVVSLQELCVRLVCQMIDHVEEFGDLAEDALDRICQLMCRNRQLTEKTLRLLLHGRRHTLVLYDCANLEAAAFRQVYMACPHLTELHLRSCGQLSEEVLAHFPAYLPHLTQLYLEGAFRVSDAAVAQVVRALPALTHFGFAHSAYVGPKLLEALGGCPQLVHARLTDLLLVTDEAVAPLARVPRLEVLSLASCELLTDAGLVPLLEAHGASLEELDLSCVFQLTDTTLAAVARCCSRLRELALQGNSNITDAGLQALASSTLKLRSRPPPLQPRCIPEGREGQD
jgi:DNA repair protein RAD7